MKITDIKFNENFKFSVSYSEDEESADNRNRYHPHIKMESKMIIGNPDNGNLPTYEKKINLGTGSNPEKSFDEKIYPGIYKCTCDGDNVGKYSETKYLKPTSEYKEKYEKLNDITKLYDKIKKNKRYKLQISVIPCLKFGDVKLQYENGFEVPLCFNGKTNTCEFVLPKGTKGSIVFTEELGRILGEIKLETARR